MEKLQIAPRKRIFGQAKIHLLGMGNLRNLASAGDFFGPVLSKLVFTNARIHLLNMGNTAGAEKFLESYMVSGFSPFPTPSPSPSRFKLTRKPLYLVGVDSDASPINSPSVTSKAHINLIL